MCNTIEMDKFPDESSLFLTKRRRKRRTIKINTVMGEAFDLKVRDSDSIYNVKERLASVIDIPAHLQSLVYNGKELKDDQVRVDTLGISDGSSLTLVQKIQTGLIDSISLDVPYRQSFKSEAQQMELHGKAILEKLSEVPELKHMLSDQATIFEVFPDENGFQVLVRTTEASTSGLSTAASSSEVENRTDLNLDLSEDSGPGDTIDSGEITEADAFKQELLRARKAAFSSRGNISSGTELLSDRLFNDPDIDLTVVRKAFMEDMDEIGKLKNKRKENEKDVAKSTEDTNTRDKMAELRKKMAQRKKRKDVESCSSDIETVKSNQNDKKVRYSSDLKALEKIRKLEAGCEALPVQDKETTIDAELPVADVRENITSEDDTSAKIQKSNNISNSSTNRCFRCATKLPLVRHACKCEMFFCSLHKQDHECSHSYT
ncbi:hypothetical protein SARC_04975 [Sphaeroforma arctica JP610]|uniref:Ubiquitin-like domain-containing protein n=1 Tax=Sphaeroforma arctica JP610 TaxID=667725 RepID=A0A0L0G3G1_9EUKA|nr:hypothetical protein SARC_04975 [Sphaeroforma arctica JP610]KNC82733.1 hypothetical protein SARC_04975 [Sphaeroforma arctica JP610]|eukprot:XP_014156635.1 hypothetical protein SARC_04975 [Sphaeroforma arctica JP610]